MMVKLQHCTPSLRLLNFMYQVHDAEYIYRSIPSSVLKAWLQSKHEGDCSFFAGDTFCINTYSVVLGWHWISSCALQIEVLSGFCIKRLIFPFCLVFFFFWYLSFPYSEKAGTLKCSSKLCCPQGNHCL